MAEVNLSIGNPREIKRKQNVAVDRNLTRDNWRVLEFRERLKHIALRDDLDVGSLCTALTTDVADAARTCFMKGKDEPRKDWISGDSWQLIQRAQILRADLRVSRANVSGMRVAVAFNALKWIAAAPWICRTRVTLICQGTCCYALSAQASVFESSRVRERDKLIELVFMVTERWREFLSSMNDAQRVAKHLARVQWQLSICNAVHRDVGA